MGSELFFVILALAGTVDDHSPYIMSSMGYAMSMGVSVVVAVLVFGFVHSKKCAVFTHSMPVIKRANFITTLLAAFTLMGVPVLAHSIIVALVTGEVYGAMMYALYTIICLFVMFSTATLAAMLTGTTWATFVLYCCVNLAFPFLGNFISIALSRFAAGYPYMANITAFELMCPPNVLTQIVSGQDGSNDVWICVIDQWHLVGKLVLVSIALYAVAYLLYVKRPLERCGDVAPFGFLNSIFKYAVTLVATMIAFDMFSYTIEDGWHTAVISIAIVSFAAYFGTEMILKKKLKIWGAYKGYIAFCAVFAAFIAFISQTSIFGYETYIPNTDEIESVRLDYNGYKRGYLSSFYPVTSSEAIDEVREVHSDIIETEASKLAERSHYAFEIEYVLKNGKTVVREYDITEKRANEIFESLYESGKHFKGEAEALFNIPKDKINYVRLEDKYHGVTLSSKDGLKLIEELKKDIEKLNYSEICPDSSTYELIINYPCEEDCPIHTSHSKWMIEHGEEATYVLTDRHTNTIEYIKSIGHGGMFEPMMPSNQWWE